MVKHSTLPLVLVLALLLLPGPAAGVNPVEQKILDAVHAQQSEAITFLETVTNVNSGTLNPEGVREVGRLFGRQFESLGMKTKWIPQDEVNRGGHLVAEQEATRGKRILLIGHLDTVFEKDGAFQRFERRGNVATGPGVNDMKGGNVVILYALKALHTADVLKDVRAIVFFTGDEESPGDPHAISRRDLVEAAKRSDVALGYETATALDEAAVARRGVSAWTLEVKAKQAHSSGIFQEDSGSGAIFEAARILNAFYEQLRGEQYLTFNPGAIVGGTDVQFDEKVSRGTAFGKTNVIARSAIARGDVRYLTPEQLQNTTRRMQEIVRNSLPGSSAEIRFVEGYPSMPPTEGNRRLLEWYSRVSEDLGHGNVKAYDPGGRGAADTSFVAPYVDAIDGLGVTGDGAHADNEFVNLDSLPVAVARTAVLLYRLSHMDSEK